jgi:hypothetical protein
MQPLSGGFCAACLIGLGQFTYLFHRGEAMTIVRQFARFGLVAAFCLLMVGCQQVPLFSRLPSPKLPDVRNMRVPSFGEISHELKPHRLHRWNRHTPPNRSSDW